MTQVPFKDLVGQVMTEADDKRFFIAKAFNHPDFTPLRLAELIQAFVTDDTYDSASIDLIFASLAQHPTLTAADAIAAANYGADRNWEDWSALWWSEDEVFPKGGVIKPLFQKLSLEEQLEIIAEQILVGHYPLKVAKLFKWAHSQPNPQSQILVQHFVYCTTEFMRDWKALLSAITLLNAQAPPAETAARE